jgi:CelD/BcsL family acetyltransferase involved in cellulose biosynthesis
MAPEKSHAMAVSGVLLSDAAMAIKSTAAAGGLVELGPEDSRWLRFAEAAPEATPFHHPAWLQALTATYRYGSTVVARLDDAGQVTAGVPLLRVMRPLAGAVYISLPFTDQVSPLSHADASMVALAGALEGWRQGKGRPGVELRSSLPHSESVARVDAGVGHLLTLGPEVGDMRRLKPAVARHVRAAQRGGVQVRFSRSSEDLATFYRLHLETRRRLGVPVQPRRFFEAVWLHVVQPGLGFIALAESATGEPLAVALFLAHNKTIVYKYGASDASHWDLKPNHLLFWRVIEWGCEQGFGVLDFGRSDLESSGLRQFKSSWGAVESPLEYSRLGQAGGAGAGGGRLASALHVVIRRSPPLVCRAVGELLYRYAA